MRNVIYIFITIMIWTLSGTFLFIHNNGMMNVSPWGMHNFVNITIQIAVILIPIIGLSLSFLIKKRVVRYVMILGCLINIYYLSIPFIFSWLHYFKVI